MSAQVIIALLSAIEAILPLLGTPQATAEMIDNIINALEQLLPNIIDEASTIYTVVKNIISLLKTGGTLTPEQESSLQSLDAQVDAQWAEIDPQIDPDNPANKGTPAGDPAAT